MPSACCVAGEIHTGTPTGSVETVNGLPCYVAKPPSGTPKCQIVILSDIFGHELPNSRILADTYARDCNAIVYLPDFFGGHALDQKHIISLSYLDSEGYFSWFWKAYAMVPLLPWLLRYTANTKDDIIHPRVFDFFRALRSSSGLPTGCAGFCWGGRWVVLLCGSEETIIPPGREGKEVPLVDCGFAAHPSQVAVPGDVEKIKRPVSVAAAGKDYVMSKETAGVFEKTLMGLSKEGGVEHEFRMYEGVHHGFAVRGSKTDEEESRKGVEACEQAVGWFKRWLTPST